MELSDFAMNMVHNAEWNDTHKYNKHIKFRTKIPKFFLNLVMKESSFGCEFTQQSDTRVFHKLVANNSVFSPSQGSFVASLPLNKLLHRISPSSPNLWVLTGRFYSFQYYQRVFPL